MASVFSASNSAAAIARSGPTSRTLVIRPAGSPSARPASVAPVTGKVRSGFR
jgi:hypothetical protein